MAKMTLSSPLFDLVPPEERAHARPRRTLPLAARSWPEAASELRTRFPELAARVLNDSGEIAEGFIFVVNGTLLSTGEMPRELAPDDEVHVITQMAGG